MIDINKTYKTRDGRSVRIYAINAINTTDVFPIHGAVLVDSGWEMRSWTICGSHADEEYDGNDLIEVKLRIQQTVWTNVYEDGIICYDSKESADNHSNPSRLACLKIEIDCEEGEGLCLK